MVGNVNRCVRRLWSLAVFPLILLTGPTWSAAADREASPVGDVVSRIGDLALIGESPDAVTIGIGAFDAVKTDPASAEIRAEYRSGRKLLFLGPIVGVMANSDGGVFGYGGFYFEFQWTDRVVFTPAAGVAAYHSGDGKPLGGTFQFYLGIDVAYRFDNNTRLGLKVGHISNADIHNENDGAESVLLTYTIPFDNPF